jgi:hypothetical protein
MLFGPIGRQVEVPWPLSGMGSDVNLYTETTDLLSGEQAVYRAPVTYKTYNMNWKTGSEKLQPLIDMYAGVYGTGPYYMTDPIAGVQGNNLLPAKWAAPHLLAHTSNGWCDPVVTAQSNTPESKQITFTYNADDPADYPKPIIVPVIPGQPLYFALWGSRTGSAQVKVYRYYRSSQSWVQIGLTYVPTLTNDAPSNVVSQALADDGDVAAIKIVPYVPAGSTLTLQHIDLAVNDYRNYTPYLYGLDPGLLPSGGLYPGMTLFPSSQFGQTVGTGTMFRSGKGVGPVQFTGNAGGKLDSVTVDRIGLSLDISEVSRDPNN